jgi:hypothetical protein
VTGTFPLWLVNALSVSSLILIVMSFFVFFINRRKWIVGFCGLGVIVLVMSVIMVNISGLGARDVRTIYSYYSQPANCGRLMSALSEDDSVCPLKYTLDATCPKSVTGDYWELGEGVSVQDQDHDRGCLNPLCCGMTAMRYYSTVGILTFVAILDTLMCGLISIGVYYLWTDRSAQRQEVGKYDHIYPFVSFVIVCIFFILTFAVHPTVSSPQEYGTNYNFTQNNISNIEPLIASQFGDNACYPFYGVNVTYDTTQCSSPSCPGSTYFLSILAQNSKVIIPPGYSRAGLTILDPINKQSAFPSAGVNDYYLGLTGDPAVINYALTNDLTLCPYTPGSTVSISLKAYQQNPSGRLLQATTNQIGSFSQTITLPLATTNPIQIHGSLRTFNSQYNLIALAGATISATRSDGTSLGIKASTTTGSLGDFTMSLPRMYADAPYLISVTASQSGYTSVTQTYQIGGKPTVNNFVELGQFVAFPLAVSQEKAYADSRKLNDNDSLELLDVVEAFDSDRQLQSTYLSDLYVYPFNAQSYNQAGGPQVITTSTVELYNGADYSVIGEQKPYKTATYSSSLKGYSFSNVPTGNYIISLNDPSGNYQQYWRIATVWKNTHTYDLPVSTNAFTANSVNNLRVTLEWMDEANDLDLYGTFNIDPVSDCLVDGISYQCQGLRAFTDQNRGAVIEVDNLGPYYYLFFVKKFVPVGNSSTGTGTYLTQSGATIKVYLPGFNAAAFQFYAEPYTWTDNQVTVDDNMVWLAFCMDGNVGPLSITPIADYWNGTLSTGTGFVPNSNICQYYLNPQNYAQPGSSQGL